MKPLILTAYSKSHESLFFEHFYPSLQETGMRRKVDIMIPTIDKQQGEFGESIFNAYMKRLMERFMDILEQQEGRLVIHCGCDMRFYQDIIPEIEEKAAQYELVSIDDNYKFLCADFFAFIVTPRIIEMYRKTIEIEKFAANNEIAFNHVMQEMRMNTLALGHEYWTVGLSNGGVRWNQGDHVEPPHGMKLHHANFTVGGENKMALLNLVKDLHDKQMASGLANVD